MKHRKLSWQDRKSLFSKQITWKETIILPWDKVSFFFPFTTKMHPQSSHLLLLTTYILLFIYSYFPSSLLFLVCSLRRKTSFFFFFWGLCGQCLHFKDMIRFTTLGEKGGKFSPRHFGVIAIQKCPLYQGCKAPSSWFSLLSLGVYVALKS